MNFIPVQRLTIGELFVSIAAGVMLFLLPNDAKNQINDVHLAYGYVFVFSLVISASLIFTIKRYESLGTAVMTNSILTVISFFIYIVNGMITKGNNFWAVLTEYQLVTMFISWVVPFFFTVTIRVLRNGLGDTSDSRMRFSHFLLISMRALMMIYILVVVFRQLLPYRPYMSEARSFDMRLFGMIGDCLNGTHENGIVYLLWNGLILAPLSFSLMILNPRMKLWHLTIICFATGVTLEILQFAFNTGIVCSDDVFLYMFGGGTGFLLKHFIDLVRSAITSGQERCMLSFSYTLSSENIRTKINLEHDEKEKIQP